MPATTVSRRVIENTYPVSSDFTPSSSAFNKLSALIPVENKLQFSTAVHLANNTSVEIEECLESESGCYMLVAVVAEDMVERIEEEMEELSLRRKVRFTYEETMQSLIVWLMPSASYKQVSWSLQYKIQNEVSDTPGHFGSSLIPVWATTFHAPGRRSKQGDAGWRPRDARRGPHQWPSVMIEVEYLESLPALRGDSEWWLVNSKGKMRMAIILEDTLEPWLQPTLRD